MITAILITTAIVIAVMVLALCKAAGRADKIMEEENIKWARKWNEQWCDDNCATCEENDNCKFSEVAK